MDTHKFKTFYKLSESESNVLKEKYCILFDKNIEDKNKNITEEQYGVLQPFQLQSNDIVKNILIPSLLTVLLIFGILLATGVISLGSLFSGKVEVPDGIVIVPDVEGMEKDEAIRTIEGMNLLVSAEGNVVSDYIQAGKIVLQSPNGGSYIEKYGIVKLIVSSGGGVEEAKNSKSIIPYVIWDTKDDAISKLKQAGLIEPKIETKNDDNVEAGKVISQSVEYGTEVDEGTQITIVVSLDPASFDMPNVMGKDIDEAKSTLSSKGLTVTMSYESSSSVVQNKVIRQSVSAGTKVKKGDSVKLTVSSGIEEARNGKSIVPYVIRDSKEDAISKLKQAGLAKPKIETKNDDNVEAGKVISQSVEYGTEVDEGTQVTIVVSLGPADFDMPNVIGKDIDEARSTLSSKGLTVTVSYENSSSVAQNEVIRQSVSAGTKVKKGDSVKLTVSSGIEETQNGKSIVPYVIQDSKEDAISKLKQAGLIEPKIETKNDDNVEAGKVISQSVEYGTEVDEGTQITIVISLGPANFDMPDVTGKDIDEARSVLSSKGLTVTVSYESSSSVAKNKVIRQSISAGTKVKKGDSIKLTVSSGVSTITVPYVVGQSKSSAVSALESAGFKTNVVEKYSSSVAKDKVISQSPSAGSSQAKNTMITLYVSKGAEPIVVPDKIIKVTLDANGGYVSPSYITINLSDSSTYSNLPTPTRDYYRYTGWYTSDGTKVSNVSAVACESDHTLYAHWKDNVSDWIKESEVPSGAQIVDTKWEYTLTEYTTSNSLLYGQTEWTLYDSKNSWSDYGNWSGWSANYLANSDSRQVESQLVVTSYTIKGYCCGNSSGIRCYLRYLQPGYTLRLEYPERVISKSDFANWTAYGEGSWFGYAPNVQGYIIGPGTGYEDPYEHVIYFITNTNYETQYRYRERHKITTYYYQKTSTKTSSYDPTGQSGVYDVVKYVKYRAK